MDSLDLRIYCCASNGPNALATVAETFENGYQKKQTKVGPISSQFEPLRIVKWANVFTTWSIGSTGVLRLPNTFLFLFHANAEVRPVIGPLLRFSPFWKVLVKHRNNRLCNFLLRVKNWPKIGRMALLLRILFCILLYVIPANRTCPDVDHQCGGMCLQRPWVCNGEKDCSDGSDEDAVMCGELHEGWIAVSALRAAGLDATNKPVQWS